MDSDDNDSDFYGDEAVREDLERRLSSVDAAALLRQHRSVQTPLKQQAAQRRLEEGEENASSSSHLHNPYAGIPYAWQLTETVPDFLRRLPPSTTDQTPATPWIWICNPYIARQPKRSTSSAEQLLPLGCEDEGPGEVDGGSDVATLTQGGTERLHFASSFIDDFQASSGGATHPPPKPSIAAAGADAARDILDLARHLRVRTGKWMLFCAAADVDEVWGRVARATANNELGIGAKVAPRPLDSAGPRRSDRLICVYTADFGDRDDVRRVAVGLKQLGLVPGGKPLYYKPDAYTYLGIASGNKWGIKASIYNTKDLLAKAK